MGKRDTSKTAKRDRQAYEWRADKMPSKKTKRAKVKERQEGETQARYGSQRELMRLAKKFMEENEELMTLLGSD